MRDDGGQATLLFVGAGRHQRRAIVQAREWGLRVVAVDRNAAAPGLAEADVAEVVDFADVGAVVEVARRHGVDGVLTVSADRAVPVVAAVTERARAAVDRARDRSRMTHKGRMRAALAAADVPQPPFARGAHARRGARGARGDRAPGGAEAGRLGRAARRLPDRGGRATSKHASTRR